MFPPTTPEKLERSREERLPGRSTEWTGARRLAPDSYTSMRIVLLHPRRSQPYALPVTTSLEYAMGKYLLGWLLGVPAVVLVGIYLVTHLL